MMQAHGHEDHVNEPRWEGNRFRRPLFISHTAVTPLRASLFEHLDRWIESDDFSREMGGKGFGKPSRAAAEIEDFGDVKAIEMRFERAHPEVQHFRAMFATAVIPCRNVCSIVIHVTL